MPYTVPVSFDQFIENISVGAGQSTTASSRANAIADLMQEKFHVLEATAMGSLMSGTGLRSVSDADVLLVLHYGKHVKGKSPRQLLQDVRDVLSAYNTRMAKKNGQAVTLYFKTWPNVDIVPACRVVNGQSFYCYEIPNMNDNSWIEARPAVHIQNMARLSVSRKNLVKMIKEWNRKHSSYLSSFHIEVIALAYPEFYEDYAWHVFQFFEHLECIQRFCIPSPAGVGGYVDDYLGAADREEARRRVQSAVAASRSAWCDAYNGNHKDAIEQFARLFGERFPAYG